MAESKDLSWESDNCFIPKHIPGDLKWYERDGLDTWYLKNKCDEFLENTDLHFAKCKVVNFDMIKSNVPKNIQKQYQTVDHEAIKQYPVEYQEQICLSIFRNPDRKDMYINKKTINQHFLNKKPPSGRGLFLEKIKDDLCRDFW